VWGVCSGAARSVAVGSFGAVQGARCEHLSKRLGRAQSGVLRSISHRATYSIAPSDFGGFTYSCKISNSESGIVALVCNKRMGRAGPEGQAHADHISLQVSESSCDAF